MGLSLVVAIGLVGAAAADLSQVFMEFRQGNRGCPHTYRITVEFVGERNGLTVVSRGTIDPPETAGFPGSQRSSVGVTLNPPLNVRKVKNVRIRIEGDRAGQDITSPWDLNEIRITNPDNRRTIYQATGLNWVFDARNTTRTSANWSTYDMQGTRTPSKNWNVIVRTGSDDLRDDSSANLMFVFRDGTTTRVNVGRAQGLRGNSRVVLPVPIGNTDQSLTDLRQVYLAKSMDSFFFGGSGKHRYFGNRDLNADNWDVAEVTALVTLGDRDEVSQSFPRLTGAISEGVKHSTFGSSFEPLAARQTLSAFNARLVVFLTGSYPQDGSADVPEIHAFIRRRGEREFTKIAGRASANQAHVGDRGAVWTGSPAEVAVGRPSAINEAQQMMRCEFMPWRGSSAPIEEVKLAVYDGSRPGGAIFQPYTGSRSVSVRGFWLGLGANLGLPPMLHDVQNFMTIGMNLDSVTTLDRNRREVVYRVTHTAPPVR
jgi:hypothetical protein